MSTIDPSQQIHTRIWQEEAETDNPFAARAAYCHGYDVYGEMLGQARWVEMLYLLFKGRPPSARHAALLENLAVAFANPGPRDGSVHAAMCGGVGGSTAAASLMAALAVGAGGLGGGHEVVLAMMDFTACGCDLALWREHIHAPRTHTPDSWPSMDHVPGFDPHGVSVPLILRQMLACFAETSPGELLPWLAANYLVLQEEAGLPLAQPALAAAAFLDLGLSPMQGEMLYLLLRLPGAAAHALEQSEYGFRKFPFYKVDLQDDPAHREV